MAEWESLGRFECYNESSRREDKELFYKEVAGRLVLSVLEGSEYVVIYPGSKKVFCNCHSVSYQIKIPDNILKEISE